VATTWHGQARGNAVNLSTLNTLTYLLTY